MTVVFVRNGGALVTRPGVVTGLTLSENNVGFAAQATLSWTAAADGAGNPVKAYDVYRDGTLYRQTAETACTVTSPEQNGSAVYTVRAIGTIEGFDGEMSEGATLTSHVTRAGVAAGLTLSANNVGFGTLVTLTWTAAADGANNPVKAYEVYYAGTEEGPYTLAATATGTEAEIPSPMSNTSIVLKVKALGTVSGFDGEMSESVTLTSHVSAPGAPTNVKLSQVHAGAGTNVTLSWTAASAGANNPVASYAIYRGGTRIDTVTGTSTPVTAPSSVGSYTYKVSAVGSVSGFDSAQSAGATLTVHAKNYEQFFYTSTQTATVPAYARSMAVSAIGGGGGGCGNGWSQATRGGGGGGAGWNGNWSNIVVTPGASVTITVGSGGAGGGYGANGGAGGTSAVSVAGVQKASISGAGGGYWSGATYNGGNGSAGGGGGGAGCPAGKPNADGSSGNGGTGNGADGGSGTNGTYGVSGGGGGSYWGTSGIGGSAGNWGSAATNGGRGANTNSYYCFSDKAAGRYLNATGGTGGYGNGDTDGAGGQGGQIGKDASGAALTGAGYGWGGNGAGFKDSFSAATSGGNGLVAIRYYFI